MRLTKNNTVVIILVVAIIVVNVITLIHIVRYYNVNEVHTRSESAATEDNKQNDDGVTKKTQDIFSVPDKIIAHFENKTIVLDNGKDFDYIVAQNMERGKFCEYFTALDPIDLENENYLEYLYSTGKKEINLELKLERRTVTANSICYVLTGINNGKFVIKTTEGYITLGTLNMNSELISRVKLLTAE